MRRYLLICLLFIAFSHHIVFAIDHVEGAPSGFAIYGGYNLTGGQGGRVVTIDSSWSPDQIKLLAESTEVLIMKFSGTIQLNGEINLKGNKTLVGIEGTDPTIKNGGFCIRTSENVIIQNLTFIDSPDDCIKIRESSRYVWIDHCTFHDGDKTKEPDGLIDITTGSDYVTLSYIHFYNHDKNILIGHNDNVADDKGKLHVTIHHCYFDGTRQRNPRVRQGTVHSYNNYYYNNSVYGAVSANNAHLLVENCYFERVKIPMQSGVQSFSNEGYIKHNGNQFIECGAPVIIDVNIPTGFDIEDNTNFNWDWSRFYRYTMDQADVVPTKVKLQAGAGNLYSDPSQPQLLKPDNASQQIRPGEAISDIVWIWAGAATGVEIQGLPEEMVQTHSTGLVTISGTPLSSFTYTVTTIGSESPAKSFQGSITVTEQPSDPNLQEGQYYLLNWYPFQESTITPGPLSTNGSISLSQSSNGNHTQGAVNLNMSDKWLTISAPSLALLKVRINPTGSRTLKVVYVRSAVEQLWYKSYASGYYEVDLTQEISDLRSTEPIEITLVNDRTSSGNLYIHDILATAYMPSSTDHIDISMIPTRVDYFDLSGICVYQPIPGICIKRSWYPNGVVVTEKLWTHLDR